MQQSLFRPLLFLFVLLMFLGCPVEQGNKEFVCGDSTILFGHRENFLLWQVVALVSGQLKLRQK